jgi:integrase
LRQAVRDRVLTVNPATAVENRRRPNRRHQDDTVSQHCWSADEAQRVLRAADGAAPQLSAFIYLALDSGARLSELHGLQWSDIDLAAGTVNINKQLDSKAPKAGIEPTFATTKTDSQRTVTLTEATVEKLRAHKREQARLKMANRQHYRDFGLVFAKEACDVVGKDAVLGQPLRNTLGDSRFATLVSAAGVRRIKFHGVRHTCATLLLGAGVPVHVVAQRLGHADVAMTLNVYAHALPSQQQDAAAKLSAVLHG